MRKVAVATSLIAATAVITLFVTSGHNYLVGQAAKPANGFAAVPGERTGQDVFGPYDVVADWPKPLSDLPGHEKWTWGAVESVFAESPNRVFVIQRGEIPKLSRPEEVPYRSVGPSISFPVSQVPFRNASVGPVT